MKWHDCKTDPPKKDGDYILWYKNGYEGEWEVASYCNNKWYTNLYGNLTYEDFSLKPYKWAIFDLSSKTIHWQEGIPTEDDLFLIWVKRKDSKRKGYIDLGYYLNEENLKELEIEEEQEPGWVENGTDNTFGLYSLENYYVYKWAEIKLDEED